MRRIDGHETGQHFRRVRSDRLAVRLTARPRTAPRVRLAGMFGTAVALMVTTAALGGNVPPGGTFTYEDGTIHEGSVEAIPAEGITKGCNPPTNDLFCPLGTVTRGQMAAFLVRALGLVDGGGGNLYVDDDDSIFETDIDRANAGQMNRSI